MPMFKVDFRRISEGTITVKADDEAAARAQVESLWSSLDDYTDELGETEVVSVEASDEVPFDLDDEEDLDEEDP